MNIEEIISSITSASAQAKVQAKRRWNSIAKPLGSLGLLEDAVIKLSGIQETTQVHIDKRVVVVMCADNGVVCEGVTQTSSDVTAIVAENFTRGMTSLCAMAGTANVQIHPIDIGMMTDVKSVERHKIAYGTQNIAKMPAMTTEQAMAAINIGIEQVKRLKAEGVNLVATGEMGIGNTTTSSAIAAVLLNKSVEEVTGKGAGLDGAGLARKIAVIHRAIAVNSPNSADPIDVLAKLGGFDIAGLVGVYLGGAITKTAILIDGFISAVAALIAVRICPKVSDYIISSHASNEPAGRMLMEELKLEPFLYARMCLGEGTGAVAAIPILDMAIAVFEQMSTFEEIKIEAYEELK